MNLLKGRLGSAEPQKHEEERDLFHVLREVVKPLRFQGDPPGRDPHTFSRFLCDLCHLSIQIEGLRQCVICGRWCCPSCWNEELYVCRSCNGIIKLYSMKMKRDGDDPGARCHSQNTNDQIDKMYESKEKQ